MSGVKSFVIFAMTAFYFPIMPWCKRFDQLMADVVVSAVGYAGLFSYKDVRPNALVIDIGINRVNGHLCGDFIPPNDDSKIMYTSVPGGIGLLTRATLMKNTKIAYEMQKNILD